MLCLFPISFQREFARSRKVAGFFMRPEKHRKLLFIFNENQTRSIWPGWAEIKLTSQLFPCSRLNY